MSAPEVIAAALNSMPADPRPSELVNQDRARIALEALEAARYKVVRLPEPRFIPADDSHHEDAHYEWAAGVSAYWNPPEVYIEPSEFSAEYARLLAAALLAAADAAEAQS